MPRDFATQHNTLESFFFEEIERAQSQRERPLPTDVEAYVVGLLARYAKRTQVAGRTSRPLAIDYLEARGAAGSQRATALRDVGDRALYISGVVPRSMSRSPVNVRYVKGIGTAAYRAVTDGPSGGHLDVLRQIAAMFDEVAEVIGDVANPAANDGGLLEIYDRWRREGDDRDLRRLVAAGVLIDPDRSDVLQ